MPQQQEAKQPAPDLLSAVYSADLDAFRAALQQGADVNKADEKTGLTPLHIATGTDNLRFVKFLIEECGAVFKPDSYGRMPTVVAAQCKVSEDLADYIFEKEAAATAGAK